MDIAREHKCEYYYAALTGIYSQAIFAKKGFKVMKRIDYHDLRDLKGNLIVPDPKEHTHMESASIRLGDSWT